MHKDNGQDATYNQLILILIEYFYEFSVNERVLDKASVWGATFRIEEERERIRIIDILWDKPQF